MFQECSSPCGRTCADLRLDGAGSCPELDGLCVSGCNCPERLVLDDGGQCVPKDVCPCRHGGELYPAGSKIRQGCNAWCVPRGPRALCPQAPVSSGGDGLPQGTACGDVVAAGTGRGQAGAGGVRWWQETPDEITLWPVCDGAAG